MSDASQAAVLKPARAGITSAYETPVPEAAPKAIVMLPVGAMKVEG